MTATVSLRRLRAVLLLSVVSAIAWGVGLAIQRTASRGRLELESGESTVRAIEP